MFIAAINPSTALQRLYNVNLYTYITAINPGITL